MGRGKLGEARTRSAFSRKGQPPKRSAATTAGEQAVHCEKASPRSTACAAPASCPRTMWGASPSASVLPAERSCTARCSERWRLVPDVRLRLVSAAHPNAACCFCLSRQSRPDARSCPQACPNIQTCSADAAGLSQARALAPEVCLRPEHRSLSCFTADGQAAAAAGWGKGGQAEDAPAPRRPASRRPGRPPGGPVQGGPRCTAGPAPAPPWSPAALQRPGRSSTPACTAPGGHLRCARLMGVLVPATVLITCWASRSRRQVEVHKPATYIGAGTDPLTPGQTHVCRMRAVVEAAE